MKIATTTFLGASIVELSEPAGLLLQSRYVAQCLSIVAFGIYGAACFVSPHITREFERYQLPHLQRLTGTLEIAGAAGLLVGLWVDPLRILAAGCLAMLMVFAVLARLRIQDSLLAMSPAIFLFALNVFISAVP